MNQSGGHRILVANDQEWAGRSIESILVANGYFVDRAYTGEQAVRVASLTRPDFVILDLQLPDIDGLEVCRRLRALTEIGSSTPIVITTASVTGRSRPVEALTAGAWDFFGQPIDGVLLLAKIKTYLSAKDEADAAKASAGADLDTGVYSERGLVVRAREAAAHARRKGQPLACVAMRPVRTGLPAAPEIANRLEFEVAAGLRLAARSADAVGRGASETFYILAPGTDHEGVVRMAARLSSAVAARVGRSQPAGTRFKTGIAVLGPENEDGDALLRQAERALSGSDTAAPLS